MKRITFSLFMAVLMITAMSGCRKDIYGCTDSYASNYNPSANISTNTCQYYGNVTFYFASNMANATVTINGQSATITQFYPNSAPNCNAVGCANFSLPAGTYAYTATSTQYTWGITQPAYATVTSNGCNTYQLQ